MSKRLLLLVCLAVPAASFADIRYTFTYTAVTGPVKTFTFSFTTPTYLSPGSSISFPAFSPTDGSVSWRFEKGLLMFDSALDRTCFLFGTSGAGLGESSPLPFGPCTISVGGPG